MGLLTAKRKVLGLRIIWVHVSRLPMPHPDRDIWKHTMFTNFNLLYFSMPLQQITWVCTELTII